MGSRNASRVVLAAALALVRIDSGQIARVRLRDLSERSLALVLQALATQCSPGATKLAWKYVDDNDPRVRAAAARILAAGAPKESQRSRLESLRLTETDPVVRYHLGIALTRSTE